MLRRNPTPAEALLWQHIRNRHIRGLKFRRQQQLGDFIVDFFCAEAKIVVEVDGDIHDLRKDADALRTRWLEEGGLKVLRLQNAEVLKDVGTVTARIADVCFSRTKQLS